MNPESALELLGPNYVNPLVRKYAVVRLKQASDSELELYLLQLVQALRFENFDSIKVRASVTPETQDPVETYTFA